MAWKRLAFRLIYVWHCNLLTSWKVNRVNNSSSTHLLLTLVMQRKGPRPSMKQRLNASLTHTFPDCSTPRPPQHPHLDIDIQEVYGSRTIRGSAKEGDWRKFGRVGKKVPPLPRTRKVTFSFEQHPRGIGRWIKMTHMRGKWWEKKVKKSRTTHSSWNRT